MNRNDLSELKKNFKEDGSYLQINTVLNAYVKVNNGIGEVVCEKIRDFGDLSAEEARIQMGILKKILSARLGKSIQQYRFDDTQTAREIQHIFYDTRNSRLQNEEQNALFLKHIVDHSGMQESYYLSVVFCDYTLPAKDRNGETLEGDAGRFPFLLAGFSPVVLTDLGLVYDPETQDVIKKENTEMQIKPMVIDGFLYPALSDGGADVNHVLYYTSKPKKPNPMMVEEMLGSTFELSVDEEANVFHDLVTNLYNEDLSFSTVKRIQENLNDVLNDTQEMADEVTLNKEEIKGILENSGVAQNNLARFDSACIKTLGDGTIYAANAMDASKVNIKAGDIKVSCSIKEKDRIKTELVNGRHCLLIELDGPLVYNGFEVIPSKPEKE